MCRAFVGQVNQRRDFTFNPYHSCHELDYNALSEAFSEDSLVSYVPVCVYLPRHRKLGVLPEIITASKCRTHLNSHKWQQK